MWKVKSTKVLSNDYLALHRTKNSFRDALVAPLSKEGMAPYDVYFQIFAHLPSWVSGLMSLRNRLVKKMGFDVGVEVFEKSKVRHLHVGDKVGFMEVITLNDQEMIGMSEDRHMQFYMSTRVQEGQVIISTMVNLKTWIGRIYMAIITPFHWIIARTVIHQAVAKKRI